VEGESAEGAAELADAEAVVPGCEEVSGAAVEGTGLDAVTRANLSALNMARQG